MRGWLAFSTPGNTRTATGWLARHLEAIGQVPPSAQIPALASGSAPPLSYLGRRDVMTLDDPSSVSPDVHIYTRSKLSWVALPDEVPAFATYYDTKSLWPAASLDRLQALTASKS